MKKQVHEYIGKHRLLRPGERVAAAVSGGADSVALLCVLFELRDELGIVLSVAHLHHGIRGPEADLDLQFVRDLAARLGLEFHSSAANVPAHAQAHKLSLETAARELRYRWLEELVRENKIDKVATAHTVDDQAETVLMRILRGAASRGLAGIFPEQTDKHLVRPLLATTRSEVEGYLAALNQPWREDSTNRDFTHTRNRIRHQLLPMLEREFNASIKRTLADLAEVAREEAAYWDMEVASLLTRLVRSGKPSRSGRNTSGEAAGVLAIDLKAFQTLPIAMQRHALHAIARGLGVGLEFKQTQQLVELFEEKGSSKHLDLPGRYVAVRTFREVQFASRGDGGQKSNYAYSLPIPGEVTVPELGSIFRARIVAEDFAAGTESWKMSLLNRDVLGAEVKVRNWRAGDRFFPARTRSPKKLKELLQADRLGYRPSPGDRALWPVVEAGNQIVWVRGFAAPEALAPNGGAQGVLIDEQKIAG